MIQYTILRYKLKAIGITGDLLNWMISYLTNRKQFAIVNGCTSQTKNVCCRVPQGSFLGPRFFSYYVSNLPDEHVLTPKYRIVLKCHMIINSHETWSNVLQRNYGHLSTAFKMTDSKKKRAKKVLDQAERDLEQVLHDCQLLTKKNQKEKKLTITETVQDPITERKRSKYSYQPCFINSAVPAPNTSGSSDGFNSDLQPGKLTRMYTPMNFYQLFYLHIFKFAFIPGKVM